MQSTRYSCQILTTPKFSRQIFAKYSNIELHENPSSCSMRPNGETDMTKVMRTRLQMSGAWCGLHRGNMKIRSTSSIVNDTALELYF